MSLEQIIAKAGVLVVESIIQRINNDANLRHKAAAGELTLEDFDDQTDDLLAAGAQLHNAPD